MERYTAFEFHRYDPHLDWSRTNGALSVINKVISDAQEDEELRKMSAAEEKDDHKPKKPINFPENMTVNASDNEGQQEFRVSKRPANLPTPDVHVKSMGDNR